jgi:hypothetical protein
MLMLPLDCFNVPLPTSTKIRARLVLGDKPDDSAELRAVAHLAMIIAPNGLSEAIQGPHHAAPGLLRRFAPRNDGKHIAGPNDSIVIGRRLTKEPIEHNHSMTSHANSVSSA